jgi:hypothetical protein
MADDQHALAVEFASDRIVNAAQAQDHVGPRLPAGGRW